MNEIAIMNGFELHRVKARALQKPHSEGGFIRRNMYNWQEIKNGDAKERRMTREIEHRTAGVNSV